MGWACRSASELWSFDCVMNTIPPVLARMAPHPLEVSWRCRVAMLTGLSLLSLAMPHFPSLASTVDNVVASEMENHGILGASVAIIEKGEVCKAQGYGFTDKTRTIPVTSNTLFQAGSISKPVAALGALRLVQDGRLTLDGDVNRWLKQW